MSIRLIAIDVDDTLVGRDKVVSPANRAAIAAARAAGVEVILITGRRFGGSADKYVAELGLGGLTYCYCGARVVAPDGSIDEHRPVPFNLALRLARFAHAAGLPLQAHVDEAVYSEPSAERVYEVIRRDGVPMAPQQLVPDLAEFLLAEMRPPTQMGPFGWDAVQAFQAEFGGLTAGEAAGPDGDGYGPLQMYVHDVGTPFCRMTILKGGVNKGEALARHSRRFGYGREEVVAFGDGALDGSMIRWAGFGVAMDNAPDWVRASARLVVPFGEEAVAGVIDRLLASNNAL